MLDVVVVGAGLAGSSIAAVLSAWGWHVRLVERRAFPHHKVCGEFLSPESQASLYAMGLYDLVAGLQPHLINQARLVSQRGVELQQALPGTAWGVSRYALDHALADAAVRAGADLQTGVTVAGVTPHNAGYHVELRTPQGSTTISTRVVIMACGRAPLPGLRPKQRSSIPRNHGYVGVKCHYSHVPMPSTVELYLFDGGYAGLAPIDGGQVNLCLLTTRAAFARAGGSDRAMLEAVAEWNPRLGQRLAGGELQPETVVSVAPVHTHQYAVPWEGMPRVGDAAVMIPPLCGDGMSIALRSAELCLPLADAFLRGQMSLKTWESCYRSLWHTEFDRRIQIGRFLERVLSRSWLADACLTVGAHVPALAHALVHATRGKVRVFDEVPKMIPAIKPAQ